MNESLFLCTSVLHACLVVFILLSFFCGHFSLESPPPQSKDLVHASFILPSILQSSTSHCLFLLFFLLVYSVHYFCLVVNFSAFLSSSMNELSLSTVGRNGFVDVVWQLLRCDSMQWQHAAIQSRRHGRSKNTNRRSASVSPPAFPSLFFILSRFLHIQAFSLSSCCLCLLHHCSRARSRQFFCYSLFLSAPVSSPLLFQVLWLL